MLGVAFAISLTSLPWASAASLDSQLQAKKERLSHAQNRRGLLTSTIENYSTRISALERHVSALRDREAQAETRLNAAQERLTRAQAQVGAGRRRLDEVRAHLRRALNALSGRLVDIYTSGDPSFANVLISADGWDDLAVRSEYLSAIQASDESLVTRVQELRIQTRGELLRLREARDRIQAYRDEIAAQKASIANARASAESRQADLASVRSQRESALANVRTNARVLEGDVSKLQDKIAEELTAPAIPSAPTESSPLPTAEASSSGFIWPVQGTLTSGFGSRWGDVHEGIDIAAAEGTPIQAAASGTVSLMQSEAESGGYGNYTCIDHGGGISTCYAHQSAFGTSLGASVQQGEVIGYVGNTGHSFGAHLHFEVRIDGVAVDPLGYL